MRYLRHTLTAAALVLALAAAPAAQQTEEPRGDRTPGVDGFTGSPVDTGETRGAVGPGVDGYVPLVPATRGDEAGSPPAESDGASRPGPARPGFSLRDRLGGGLGDVARPSDVDRRGPIADLRAHAQPPAFGRPVRPAPHRGELASLRERLADGPSGLLARTAAGPLAESEAAAPEPAGLEAPEPGLRLYPNPVRDRARVTFSLGADGPARVAVIDVTGREVAVAFDGSARAGEAVTVDVPVGRLTSGTYLVVLEADGRRDGRTFQVVR